MIKKIVFLNFILIITLFSQTITINLNEATINSSLKRDGYNQMEIGKTDSLWIIGAGKDDDNFAVLLSNISFESKKVNFSLEELPVTIEDYDIQFSIVDKNYDGNILRELKFNNLILSPYSITLVKFSKKLVSVELKENEIYTFILLQNYPNPFNPSRIINYPIPANVNHQSSIVSLKTYDVLGKEVTTLVNKEQAPGNYQVEFRIDSVPSASSLQISSGIYYYKLQVGAFA